MTFRSLVLSNVQGNWRSYIAFFMSSVFSVMTFYIYAAFLAHPDVVSGHIAAAAKVRKGMVFCEYVIIIFSFLFVLYSNLSFFKTRKREFGLFSLFGMTREQLRKFIIYENMTIAVLAIGVGIGLGIVFSKLFFMALGVMLDIKDTIVFAVPPAAVWLTVRTFFMLFAIISLWIALRMRRIEMVDLFITSQQPKGQLVYSPWLAGLAVVCIVTSYSMALMLNVPYFDLMITLILITVLIGTYLLFTQVSIMLLGFIQKRVGIYYHRTNMIIFAQIGYKLKDNARMLFIVAILSAVILTVTSATYMLALAVDYQDIKTQYDNSKEVISLTMFIGMFISLLFFIASGSMIYFKLFTDLQEDQVQFKALSRIGMTQGEIRQVVFTQVSIIFFLPCIVGIIHALVAMKALDHFLMLSNWYYSFIIIGIYVIMQTIFFLITCHSYMKSIMHEVAS
ncbi:FtsX-like permease family protein [Bacillus sp. FJAT-52991]|uniref:FtsX-like permease family protein n=1 Tax=Bacillus kandeliae TaxID=3129297 RepID=A0ABZ2N1W9_9BACI